MLFFNFRETLRQPECPTRPLPSTSCPPPSRSNCCEIQNYFPEKPEDCSTDQSKNLKPKNL